MDWKYRKWSRSGLELVFAVLKLDQKWIRTTGSRGLEVLDVEQKWIRSAGSRLEVDQKYQMWNKGRSTRYLLQNRRGL